MSLPDGRMWAYLDRGDVDAIVGRVGDVPVEKCRGWWGAPTGPSQVAERAVLAEVGWSLDSTVRRVVVEERVGSDAAGRPLHRVSVMVDDVGGAVSVPQVHGHRSDHQYEVVVSVAREVPVIACEAPGGRPHKPGVEWGVRSIEKLDR